MIFQHFLIGFIMLVLGVLGVKFNYQLVGFTGNIEWVERYLGGGSTYAFLKIVAVLLSISGFMYMFGLFDPAAHWLLSPLAQLFHMTGS